MYNPEAQRKYRQSPKGIAARRRQQRNWHALNKEKRNASCLDRYYANHEKRRVQQKIDYAANPGKYRHWQLWTLYRLTPERYQELFDKQGGKCPCGYSFVINNRNRLGAHVDHDHKCCSGNRSCGKCVRGLLCRNCNRALGLLKDSPELLRTLASWVEVSSLQEL